MSRRSCACIELGRPAVPFTVPRLDGGQAPCPALIDAALRLSWRRDFAGPWRIASRIIPLCAIIAIIALRSDKIGRFGCPSLARTRLR
jgi:hypothetical protein